MCRIVVFASLIFALSAFAEEKPDIPALVKQLQSKDKSVRMKALRGLGNIGEGAKAADYAVVKAMMDVDEYPLNRSNYLECLEKLNPMIYKHVVTVLVDKDRDSRQGAMEEIAKLKEKGKAALPIFHHYFHQEAFGDARLVPAPVFRAMVAVAPENKDTIKIILGIVGSPSKGEADKRMSGAREIAIELLPLVKADKADKVLALVRALRDRPNTVATIKVLADMGPDAKGALPALNRMKLDEEKSVREAAADAIQKISKK